MPNFPLPTRLGEVVDQNRLERQVEQPPPLPLDPRILEDLPAGARPRESAITPLPWIHEQTCCQQRPLFGYFRIN
jgi:hypothetical protein